MSCHRSINMDHICKICGAQFELRISLERHVSISYSRGDKIHCLLLEYKCKYENDFRFSKENLHKMYYDDRKSTPMITEELQINKATLIRLMHHYGFVLRNFAEATSNQILRDGLWNKGKTKLDHPSILKYANSRMGKNNPYYTAPGFEERRINNIMRFKGIEQKASGSNNPKTTEARMVKILDSKNIQYVRHFSIKYKDSWRSYDFLIDGHLIIEMQGSYYHADPKRYKSDDVIVVARKKRCAREIWDYDTEKENLAKLMGYDYLTIWESDFCEMTDEDVVVCLKKKINN